jgi:hypothetical protein
MIELSSARKQGSPSHITSPQVLITGLLSYLLFESHKSYNLVLSRCTQRMRKLQSVIVTKSYNIIVF